MIDQNRDGKFIRCDSCDEATEPVVINDRDDFIEMIAQAKRGGWEIIKNENDEFEHYCPDCK